MSLGPITSSRGLSLSEPWFRYMATHLRKQATEDLQGQRPRRRRSTFQRAMTDIPSPTKQQMRILARRVRRDAALRRGAEAAAALAARAGGLGLAAGAVVAGYWPLAGEIDPLPLMAELAVRGHVLALPVVAETGGALEFRPWAPGDPLESGPHGTRHPYPQPPIRPDALLIPLLAFDRRGFRLGYGGGYYDRTLASLRRDGAVQTVGLAFAAQEVERVPADPWDEELDRIVTELGVIVTAGR
jgi:5-formyltetrahydrofolate cyclo-ligase